MLLSLSVFFLCLYQEKIMPALLLQCAEIARSIYYLSALHLIYCIHWSDQGIILHTSCYCFPFWILHLHNLHVLLYIAVENSNGHRSVHLFKRHIFLKLSQNFLSNHTAMEYRRICWFSLGSSARLQWDASLTYILMQ